MTTQKQTVLGLRAGEMVEVRTQGEILSTLDEHGRFENLPFMPEMLQFCGKRFRVSARADKTCDPAHIPWSLRRLTNSVHLDAVRCDGAGHGGCEAGCLMFWKEAWLRRVDPNLTQIETGSERRVSGIQGCASGNGSTECIMRGACTTSEADPEPRYSCQATELRTFTSHLPWWDVRQYVRDVTSGNLSSGLSGHSLPERFLEMILSATRVFQGLLISFFNSVQRKRRGVPFPLVEGELSKTPLEVLNLQPGELVQVKSREEIVATLDTRSCNRGLLFDAEMLRWCGGIYRVLRRVHHIVDEKNGRMLHMKNPCIVLEGVWCRGDYHKFCQKAIWHYWRENWLRRAGDIPMPARPEDAQAEECESCVR